MTLLHKRVKRETEELIREKGKSRQIIVTLYPGALMGLRLKGNHKEYQIGIRECYYRAAELSARHLIAERKERRKQKRLAHA